MIRVCTPSRLHFGLLSVAASAPGQRQRWPNRLGEPVLPARRYGSVGLMIQAPGIQLSASPAPTWSTAGPSAERALRFAERFVQALPAAPPQHLVVEHSAPEHMGLGTGTQLGLSVARALALAAGLPHLDAVELSRLVGRGLRSALGVYGFARGGFLVDGGKGEREDLAPLIARVPFPAGWRVVLVLPFCAPGLHGVPERQAFARLAEEQPALAPTDALCRLVLLGMLPALVEQDFAAFSEALYDFNVRVGELFAPVQGGTYAHPRVGDLVAYLRRQGGCGAGQSSWGPAVFAVALDEDQANHLAGRVRRHFALEAAQVLVTGPCNQGAVSETLPDPPAPGMAPF